LINATERAVSRNGVRRTTMSDLAREMNVARTTLYRQVDSVDEAIVLAGARAKYRFLDEVSVTAHGGTQWPELFIDAIVQAISLRGTNALVRRLFEHEPELLGEALSHDGLAPVMQQLGEVVTGVLETAVSSGHLRCTDPRLLAELLPHAILALMLGGPPPNVRDMVGFLVRPMLTVSSPHGNTDASALAAEADEGAATVEPPSEERAV
jgi:AcrR family transcriptional regulator